MRCRLGPLWRHKIYGAGAATAALLLATSTVGAGTAGASSAKVTLTYLTHNNEPPATTLDNAIIAKFEKQHPGVVVKQIEEMSGTTYTKFETMASAGDYPNVYDMYQGYAGSIIPTGVASPVDYKALGYTSQSAFLRTYLPGSFGAYKYNGKAYGIPDEVSNYVAWVIPGDYKAAGVPVPSTWAQVCADGPKMLKKVRGRVVQEELALPTTLPASQAIMFDAISREYGSSDFNLAGTKSYLTSPPVIAAATMLQNLVYKCHAAVPSLNSSAEGADRIVYWDGHAAMDLTMGTWNSDSYKTYPKVRSQVAYPYPGTKPGETANDLYGYAQIVPKRAPNQALSWQLAAALAGPGLSWLKEEGAFTGAKSVADSPTTNKVVPHWSTFWKPEYAKGVYVENLVKGPQIDQIIGSALDSILLSDANVKSTLQSANAQILPLLNKS
jgi:ABC-type glycerol-3-phosphate transport system substrate-binding protein